MAITSCEQREPTKPNWEVLKLLLDQAVDWIMHDDAADEYGPAEIETLSLLHELLFKDYESDEARLKDIAFRLTCMAQATEGLADLLYPFRPLTEFRPRRSQ